MKKYCEIYKNEIATTQVTYGLYEEYKKGRHHYSHNLCDLAAKELWDKCSAMVNNGLMHWSNKSIN